ncbi:hypothetical protein [Shouchella shacheensis]|uniref:hypothetical protein n=1 Tax=Shouchella shacheensis TaxID=1649580 RepID=UPI00074024A6|nr:hypothetical protein [Shouchella shacheensis]
MEKKSKDDTYHDFSNVEVMHDYVSAQHTPEGPYGSPIKKDTPVKSKQTPWEPGQRSYSAFNYEDKAFHEGRPRKFPNHHPPK